MRSKRTLKTTFLGFPPLSGFQFCLVKTATAPEPLTISYGHEGGLWLLGGNYGGGFPDGGATLSMSDSWTQLLICMATVQQPEPKKAGEVVLLSAWAVAADQLLQLPIGSLEK